MNTEILYEDEDILVIYKPPGLAAQTSKVGQPDVVSELKNYLYRSGAGRSAPYLSVIHRLDQPVEGLLVFARNKHAAAFLTEQLQKQNQCGSFHKHYYAVLCGVPSRQEGELIDFLYKNHENKAIIVNSAEEQPIRRQDVKRASLQYRILRTQEGEVKLSLAEIQLHTGRFHQIRAQMGNAGLPLLGDVKYGNEESERISRNMGVRNVALCAYCLSFIHPVSKKQLTIRVKPRGRAFSIFSQTFFSMEETILTI